MKTTVDLPKTQFVQRVCKFLLEHFGIEPGDDGFQAALEGELATYDRLKWLDAFELGYKAGTRDLVKATQIAEKTAERLRKRLTELGVEKSQLKAKIDALQSK